MVVFSLFPAHKAAACKIQGVQSKDDHRSLKQLPLSSKNNEGINGHRGGDDGCDNAEVGGHVDEDRPSGHAEQAGGAGDE